MFVYFCLNKQNKHMRTMATYPKSTVFQLTLVAVAVVQTTTLCPVVILTHGVLWLDKKESKKTHWFEPGGNFFDAIQQTASTLGHTTLSYRWQQPLKGLTASEHKKAAHGLCNLIKMHIANATSDNDRKIIIIAHSMGGKVAALASNLLYNGHAPEERPNIDALFTLGTPHLRSDPQPNMRIINRLFNIISENDKITHGPISLITGTGPLLDPIASHERATTLLLESEISRTPYHTVMTAPNHQALHSDIVGSHLLKLIALIEQAKDGFSKFSFLHNGRLRFFHNGTIEYEPII